MWTIRKVLPGISVDSYTRLWPSRNEVFDEVFSYAKRDVEGIDNTIIAYFSMFLATEWGWIIKTQYDPDNIARGGSGTRREAKRQDRV